VHVVQPFKISATPPVTSVCLPDATQQIQFFAYGAYRYTWSPATWLNDSTVFNPQVIIPAGALATGTQLVYHVTGYDQYRCFTDTASVILNAGLSPVIDYGTGNSGVAGRTVTLHPLTEMNGPFNPFSWSVLSGNGTVTCLNGTCDSVQLTINSDVTFKVMVENVYGCTTTDTIHYSASCSQGSDQVYIPTGFSPDGDGINDIFMVQGEGIVVDYFKVFNRWGQLVFDGGSNFTPNLPSRGWNGTLNGRPVDEDVYVYVAKVTCTAANISYFKKGNVTLIRVKK
jgi:gliding motility-associated-like protein